MKNTKKPKRMFKRLVKCQGCGKKFIAPHKLRLYCDKCRGKGKK